MADVGGGDSALNDSAPMSAASSLGRPHHLTADHEHVAPLMLLACRSNLLNAISALALAADHLGRSGADNERAASLIGHANQLTADAGCELIAHCACLLPTSGEG